MFCERINGRFIKNNNYGTVKVLVLLVIKKSLKFVKFGYTFAKPHLDPFCLRPSVQHVIIEKPFWVFANADVATMRHKLVCY